jgi:hypothetical protein
MADNNNDPRPLKEILKVRELLQAVENAIVDAGYDEFVVACERGTFKWQSVERARAELDESPPTPAGR